VPKVRAAGAPPLPPVLRGQRAQVGERRELATLVEDAVFLWKAGVLRREQLLRQLRNLAHRRIPSAKATKKIDEVVAALEQE
jgi:hypothetical protein